MDVNEWGVKNVQMRVHILGTFITHLLVHICLTVEENSTKN